MLVPDFIDLSTYAHMGQAEASRKLSSSGSGSILQYPNQFEQATFLGLAL